MNKKLLIKTEGKLVGPTDWSDFVRGIGQGAYNPQTPIRFEDSPIWTSYEILERKRATAASSNHILAALFILFLGVTSAAIVWSPGILLISGGLCLITGFSAQCIYEWREDPARAGLGIITAVFGVHLLSNKPAQKWIMMFIYVGAAQIAGCLLYLHLR